MIPLTNSQTRTALLSLLLFASSRVMATPTPTLVVDDEKLSGRQIEPTCLPPCEMEEVCRFQAYDGDDRRAFCFQD